MTIYQERLDDTSKKYLGAKNVNADVSISEIRDSFGTQLPDAIYDVWDRVGFGVFFDGYFQLCDPRKYNPISEIIFSADNDFRPQETYILGFSAFGKLLAWNTKYRIVDIDLVNGIINCRYYFKPKPNVDPNMNMIAGVLLADSASYDVSDNNGKGMFSRVKAKLGELSFGQIYGFRPILALGGFRKPEALKIYDALPHMAILAQAQPMELKEVTYAPPL